MNTSVGDIPTIVAALRSIGVNDVGVAGFLGNFDVETGGSFSTNSYNAGENAHGWANWEGGRWVALQQYASAHHLSPTSPQAQAGYLIQEVRGMPGFIAAVNAAGSPAQAAALIDAQFERSSGAARSQREQDATALYGSRGSWGSGSTPPAAPAPAASVASGSGVNALADFKFPGQSLITGTLKDLGKIAGLALPGVGQIAGAPFGTIKTVTQGLEGIGKSLSAIAAVFSAALWLTQPSSWLRIGSFLMGLLALGIGGYLLATSR